MPEHSWRQKCGPVGAVVVCVGGLAYIGKLMVSQGFIASHSGVFFTWTEIGFLLGTIGVILGLITSDKKFKTPVLLGSMIVIIVWFCDIAWSAVTK
jgi:hypothetical protein